MTPRQFWIAIAFTGVLVFSGALASVLGGLGHKQTSQNYVAVQPQLHQPDTLNANVKEQVRQANSPAKAPTAEETVAYMVLSMDSSTAPESKVKLIQSSPATYDVNMGLVPLRQIVRALNLCTYHVETIVDLKVAGRPYKNTISFDVDFTNAAPNGSWSVIKSIPYFKIDGVKIANCDGKQTVEGDSVSAPQLAFEAKSVEGMCQDMIANGFSELPWATSERASTALRYFHDNFCKGQAF